MLLAFWAKWIGQSATMELSGNHRCGCCATSMEGVCHGEACYRAEALLHVRDGRAREADRGQGRRRKTRTTLYGRGSTRWPLSSRRRIRPRASCSGTATFGIGKRPGAISSRYGPGDTFPGRNRPIWEAGMRRRPSTSAYRPSKRTTSGFGRCMWLAVTVSGAVVRDATLYNFPNPSLT